MKIKNLSALRFLVLILICFFSVETFAFFVDPPPTVGVDNQKSANRPDTYLISCDEDLEMSVFVTNLIYDEGDYILPSTATPIYLKSVIGNSEYIIPIEYFEPSISNTNYELPLYKSTVSLPAPFENICIYEEGKGELEDNTTEVAFQISLVDVNGNPYPFWLNDDADSGIFSCLLFCNDCYTDPEIPGSCVSSAPYEGTVFVDCSPCLISHPDEEHESPVSGFISHAGTINAQHSLTTIPKIENNSKNLNDLSSNQKIQEFITISPNPFHDELYIEMSNQNDQDIKINIFDSKGQSITQNIKYKNGQEKIIIDSNSWEQGLYFIHLKTPTEIKTYKVVKINR